MNEGKLIAAAFAVVCFVIAAFFAVPRVNIGWLGAAFLTVAIALP